tara:strand:+ start:430 stop:603 length:174 start_codon:yes stop_codon:yes gene_type:complete
MINIPNKLMVKPDITGKKNAINPNRINSGSRMSKSNSITVSDLRVKKMYDMIHERFH